MKLHQLDPSTNSSTLTPDSMVQPGAERRTRGERRGGVLRAWYGLLALSALAVVSFAGTLAERGKIGQEIDMLRHDLVRLQQENHELTAISAELFGRLQHIEDRNSQWAHDHGLFAVKFLQEKSRSVLPVISVWSSEKPNDESHSSGTYLGEGYFLTVKHGIFRSRYLPEPMQAEQSFVLLDNRRIPVTLVDAGEARTLHTGTAWGDWAVVRTTEPLPLVPLGLDLTYSFEFGDPIARIGNDHGKGILFATGYLGRRMTSGLYTTLTATHTGISGGPVLDTHGRIIAIAVGKQLEGDNFAYIQPILPEMLRKVPHLNQ